MAAGKSPKKGVDMWISESRLKYFFRKKIKLNLPFKTNSLRVADLNIDGLHV